MLQLNAILLCILAIFSINYAIGNVIIEDEFIQTKLPGGILDSRELPNIPFQVDANRLSDGVSSFWVLDSTSSAFPLYNISKSTEVNVEPRRQHGLAITQNQAAQGVAYPNAGAYIREEAVLLLTGRVPANNTLPPSPPPTKNFQVYASEMWNPSGFALQKGESYKVEVLGSQYWVDGHIKCDANGYPSYYDAFSKCYAAAGRCYSYLKNARRVQTANWMELICGIGNFVTKLQEVADGLEYYVPVQEQDLIPTYFNVATSVSFVSEFTGELICFANEAYGLYYNNIGSLNVTVTRLSWPPHSNFIYYKQQQQTNEQWQNYQNLGGAGVN